MKIAEIPATNLDAKEFIRKKAKEIAETVGDGSAITALSGGVDSSVVTLLGHMGLGHQAESLLHRQRTDATG